MRNSNLLHQLTTLASLAFTCVNLAALPPEGPAGKKDSTGSWPQFRGPFRNGRSDVGGQKLELTEPKILWQKEIGTGGYSGLSALDDLVYTLYSDGDYDYAVALDVSTGNKRWLYRLDKTYKGHSGSHDGPHSTPTIAGDHVYFLSPHGALYALARQSGRLIWGKDIKTDLGGIEPFYGFATSPLVHGESFLLQVNGSQEHSLVALNRLTGQQQWAIFLENAEYTSPVVAQFAGTEQVLCRTDRHLFSVSPVNGKILWQIAAEEGSTCSPLVISENRVFLAGWKESAMHEIGTSGTELTAQQVWRSSRLKKSLIAPVFSEGYLYGFSASFLTCIDARTGKETWRARQGDNGSAILAGDKLVVVTESGTIKIIQASPENYIQMASIQVLRSATVSPPAYHRGNVYVRGLREIACVKIAN